MALKIMGLTLALLCGRSMARSGGPDGRSRSILPGGKRGQACVSALAHQSEQVAGQTYYDGSKESGRPVVRKLLAERGLCSQKVALDTLHLVPKTGSTIHSAKGVYLIGLKSNQAHPCHDNYG